MIVQAPVLCKLMKVKTLLGTLNKNKIKVAFNIGRKPIEFIFVNQSSI